MANDKDIIKKLLKIAENQQKIIAKIAQVLPNKMEHDSPTKKEALAILSALPPAVRAVVDQLEVHVKPDTNEVKVRFMSGKSSPMAFSAIQKTVQTLQSKNVLAGSSYKITEVA